MSARAANGPKERHTTYGEVFAIAEFRNLWFAQVLSLLGDQLAQVALAILVLERTGSPLLTAMTYSLTYLPQIAGGPLLAGLADRFSRRSVMIVCDLIRAVLIGAMAIPQMPFVALCVLLFASQLTTAPFSAARAAIMPDVLRADRYVLGTAVTNMTHQATQVLGFAVGGAVVLFLGSHRALAMDAATFVASALVLTWGVRRRPAARRDEWQGTSLMASTIAGARLVFGDRRLRVLVALAWLCGFYVVPEGLAAPYAETLNQGAVAVGLLMAAMPAGAVAGAFLFGRFVTPSRRLSLMGPMAMLSCAPLIGSAFQPGLVIVLALWGLSGIGTAYQLAANAAFVAAVPASDRAQAFGLVQAGILAVQGIGILIGGAGAQFIGPQPVVALSGGAGLIAAIVVAGAWKRASADPASELAAGSGSSPLGPVGPRDLRQPGVRPRRRTRG